MKIRYMKSFVLSLLSALALAACGGGGGGGGPAVVDTTPPADPNAFSLSALQSIAPSTLEFSMTGDDTDGIQYTASLKITNHPNDYQILGKKVTRIQSEFSLTNTTADPVATSTSNASSYYASGYELVATTLNNPATVTCVPDSYNAPPDSVVVGDHGDNYATLTCKNIDGVTPDSKIVITWRLEEGPTPGTDAKFIVTETSYTGAGLTLDSIEEARYIINKAGTIKGIEVKVTSIAGVIRSLAGDKL